MSSPSIVSHAKSDAPFYTALGILGGGYVLLIVAMVAAEMGYARLGDFSRIFADENIRFAIRLSVISASISTILALWVSVPIAYLMCAATSGASSSLMRSSIFRLCSRLW